MEWIVADLKIAVVLLAWIVAMVGIGNVVYNIINSRRTKPNSPFGEANSSLGETFRPFENFEHSQTHSLASRPKFSKEAKASTANTRILGETQGDSAEFNAESLESSLRGQSPKQSIYETNLTESRRIERVKNAESLNDSNDSIELNHNMDCHDSATQNLAMTAKGDSMESSEKIKIDCHEDIASRNDASQPRHCEGAKQPKQSILQHQKSSDFADSSDFTQSPTIFPDNFAIRIFASLLFGVIIVSFLTSLLHLFIPITPIVSIAFLALGIALFALKIRDFHLLDFRVLFSGAVAFAIVAILGFFHDSIGDSVNYHIQIVTWIQNSPLIFGLGNIHGRLGFNGIIYNFYAVSDVSQIFPALRSFIANEIIYFAFIFAVVYILATGAFRRFYLLFIVCCAIPFSFILKWAEFNGLYCEGIGLVFGVFVGAMVCYVVGNQRKHEQKANSSLGNHCIDLANFECSIESSLASRPKFSKEAKASTASRRLDERSEVPNTRILGEMQSDSNDSMVDCHEDIASRNDENGKPFCNSIDSHESQSDSRNDGDLSIPRKSLESHKPTTANPTHFSNALLFILFIISVFAAQVKIANTALCLCVAIIFIYLNRDFYRIKFYKYYVILGILCVIFVLPWAIKGVATSGMVAYPAGIFFFESLPFAVSEAQRESEVCWIMSWARAPGKNCVEVLANSAWLGEWFSMKTRYFGWYFKHFVYNFFASLALLGVIIIYAKAQKRRIDSTKYLIAFVAFFAGAIFWFFSGPDPRFGMVYIFPLIGILLAFNITEIKNIASKKARIVFIVALLFTLMPFWKLTRDMYIILILLCVLIPSFSAKWRKFYYALIIILSFVSIPNIYRKQLGSIKQLPKVLPIYAKEQITDYGVSVFHRSDELKDGYKAYDYEPMPTTPYFSSHIKEERFLGRKAYINTDKESK